MKEMNEEIVKFDVPELRGIEPSKAEQIKAVFEPMAEMLLEFEQAYEDVLFESATEMSPELIKRAKRLRLDIGKVRVETDKIRKAHKEEYLRAGKAIDGVSNILKWAVVEKENKLKEIENYYEIQEQKRLEALQAERAERLFKYVEDAHDRDLTKFEDDEFEALLFMKKKEYEDRIAAKQRAIEERIAKEKAKAEERERMRKENERLRKEAEKRAKEERERKAREDAERKIREEKERKERAEYEAKLQAEREAREKIEREERARREKLEAELKAKEEAERKAKEEEEARLQAELNKGDAAKVKDLLVDLEQLKTRYTFKSAKNKKMYADVGRLIEKVINHIKG